MRNLDQYTVITALLGPLTMGASIAQAASGLPPVQNIGQIEYMTGGIGKTESTAMENVSKQWPLTLEFAVKDKNRADFAANVDVIVRNAKGQTTLKTTSDGPFLMIRLAPGHYLVDATLSGKTLHEKVNVKLGQVVKSVFEWPAGTDKAKS